MKKERKFKMVLVVLLSVIMGLTLSSYNIVRADDGDDLLWTGESGSTSSSLDSSDDDWDDIENEIDNNTSNLSSIVDNSQANNNVNNNVNNNMNINNTNVANNTPTTANANSLAKTGIEDSKGALAIVVVISVIVAIYSLRKIKEYKNM